MRLAIRHDTTYRFDPPMRGVIQSLRLWPSQFEGQTTLEWTVNIDGAARGPSFRDAAGDKIDTAVVMGPVSEVIVAVSGLVETKDLVGVLRGHREKIVPQTYLRHTHITKPDSALLELAEAAVGGVSSELDRAHALSDAIRDAIEYKPSSTDSATTAVEALAAGEGVCQDHAHALIAAALAIEIPARYVTGYLHAEDDMAEASHAWAELYVEDLGWVGFDASNDVCPDERYVRIGSGYDAVDAAPIRGVAQGVGTEALKIDVNVVEATQ